MTTPHLARHLARWSTDDRPDRLRGDRGTTFVAAMVVMFTVTGAAAIYLAHDVNQRVSDRSALQSIAFQSARAGAQQLDVVALRTSGGADPTIDAPAAERAARAVAARLAGQYELDIEIVDQFGSHDGRVWTVVVALPAAEAGHEGQRATGVARVETGG